MSLATSLAYPRHFYSHVATVIVGRLIRYGGSYRLSCSRWVSIPNHEGHALSFCQERCSAADHESSS